MAGQTKAKGQAGGKSKPGELKTRPNDADVGAFIDAVEDEQKRVDALALLEMMKRVTGCEPVMWGPSIIGFGTYSYTNTTGREAQWCATGFSPRKSALTLYIMPGFSNFEPLMDGLGKYKTGKSCLYIKRLSDIDAVALEQLIARAYQHIKSKYPD